MNFQKFPLKWKIVKHFTRPKPRVALKKLFRLHHPAPTPPDENLLSLWNKIFLKEIYRNIQTFAFKVLLECSSWACRNGAVWHHQMFAGKFLKWKMFLAVLREHILFNVELVEVGKMIDVFWVKLYCKISDNFCYSFLALILYARKYEIIKNKLWYVQ